MRSRIRGSFHILYLDLTGRGNPEYRSWGCGSRDSYGIGIDSWPGWPTRLGSGPAWLQLAIVWLQFERLPLWPAIALLSVISSSCLPARVTAGESIGRFV